MPVRKSKTLTILCPPCEGGKHTNPPNGGYICQCGERTCACYGMQVRAGARVDRRST